MRTLYAALLIAGLLAPACATGPATQMPEAPRLVMFIGVDISGSFMHGKDFNDSIQFLARYIHAPLYGLGGMEKPHSLFVGSIRPLHQDHAETAGWRDPKTLLPGKADHEQEKFSAWVRDTVDFQPRLRRVE